MSGTDELRERGAAALRARAEEAEHLVGHEPPRCSLPPDRCAIAALAPVARMLAEPGGHRVAKDVRDRVDQMGVRVDRAAPKAIVEEMAHTAVAVVGAPRVIAVDLLQTTRDSTLGRTENDVGMRRHVTPGEDLPAVPRRSRAELFPQAGAVGGVEGDRAAVVAARDDVVDPVRIEDAKLAAHGHDGRSRTVTKGSRLCNGV
jgi:hypothetical protein